jgi:hypothetical protein
VVSLLEKYPNVCIDMAPGWEMFGGFKDKYDEWYEIFRKYADRFVYATDRALPNDPEFLKNCANYVLRFLETDDEFEVRGGFSTKGIKLEREYLDRILYKNHERIVGQKPRQINRRALKKYIDRYLPLIPDSKNKELTEEYYRRNLT